jgi:hypothetical protein
MRSPYLLRIMIVVLTFVLCGGPQLMQAQEQTTLAQTTPRQQENTNPVPATSDQANPQPTDQQETQNQNAEQSQTVGSTQQNATPDPSKAPQKPTDSSLPNAPSSTQKNSQQQPEEAPAGAAAAQAGKTAGGAASRPAGTAIAPAKQHQTRSLLIKIGAVGAGAAALGIIYGLSRSSPSVPPGARTTAIPASGR